MWLWLIVNKRVADCCLGYISRHPITITTTTTTTTVIITTIIVDKNHQMIVVCQVIRTWAHRSKVIRWILVLLEGEIYWVQVILIYWIQSARLAVVMQLVVTNSSLQVIITTAASRAAAYSSSMLLCCMSLLKLYKKKQTSSWCVYTVAFWEKLFSYFFERLI